MFLDIDSVEDLDTLKNKVNALPYTVLSAESVSGGGLFVVFCIDNVTDGNDYRRAYCAAIKYLYEQGLSGNCEVDEKTIDPVRFRYQTIDPKPHYNPNAQLWTQRAEQEPSKKREPKKKATEPMEPMEPEKPKYQTPFTADLMQDYYTLSLTEFKSKHLDEIPLIIAETEYDEVRGKDYLIPCGIRCRLPRYRNGLKRNHDRNKTLYVACIVMLYLNPSLHPDDYLIAMVDEFLTYYIEDGKWNKYRLLPQIVRCWYLYQSGTRPTEDKRMPATKPNPEYCMDHRVSRRSHAPKASKHHRWDTDFNPADFYDPSKTIAENIEAMASPTQWLKAYDFSGKKIARNTLLAALREQHITTYEERREDAIVSAYIWGASGAKDLQQCGDYALDPKTARKRFIDFEGGRTCKVTSAAFHYWMMNRVSRNALIMKKKNTKGILSRANELK